VQTVEADDAATTAATPDAKLLDLDRYVPGLITFLANKLSRSASAIYRRNFQVGINEWRVMSQLALEPWISASRICGVIGIDKSVVSRSLALLEGRGLVQGQDAKGTPRRRLMALTGSGRALHDRMIAVALERERRLLACLTPAEQASLVNMLDRLHRRIPAVNQPLEVTPPTRRPRRG
jgi:DNA-binding MarR family transcriptional regulator